jgi:hypothetical protein
MDAKRTMDNEKATPIRSLLVADCLTIQIA